MPQVKSKTKPKSPIKSEEVPEDVSAMFEERLLTPEQYESITRANNDHALSYLVLRLFLLVNHLWHICRLQQGKTQMAPVDWAKLEMRCKLTVEASLANLLQGVDPSSFTDDEENRDFHEEWKRRYKLRIMK